MKVFLCDFEDSFTYNIYAELVELGMQVEVVPLVDLKDFLEKHVNSKGKLAIVLGPGPGNPDEREDIIEVLKKLMSRENLFLMGICLGHQLIARAFGLGVCKSARPVHGEVERHRLNKAERAGLGLNLKEIQVQRYNSLAAPATKANRQILKSQEIFALEKAGEALALRKGNILTYQFHPESVGTSFPSLFFEPLKAFLL